MAESLSAFSGEVAYVDAVALVGYLDRASPFHPGSAAFFARAVNPARPISLVTASLTFDEVAIVLLQELVARPPFNVSQDRTRYLSRHPENVSQLMGTVSPLLSAASSVVDIAPVTGDDISAMTRAMGAYGMLPRDAIHLAVAQRLGITAIVSDDDVFDRVPGLMLFRP